MNVSQLIEKLQEYPPTMRVRIGTEGDIVRVEERQGTTGLGSPFLSIRWAKRQKV